MFLMWELPQLLAIQEVPGQGRLRESESESEREKEISRLWLPRAWKKAAFRAALKGIRLWFWQEHPLHSISQ